MGTIGSAGTVRSTAYTNTNGFSTTRLRPAPRLLYSFVRPHHVHQADCVDLLSKLDDDSAALIVIDPPAERGVGKSENNNSFDERLDDLCELAAQCKRVLKPGGLAVSLGDSEVLMSWHVAARWSKLDYLGEIAVVWDRPAVNRPHAVANMPSMSLSIRRYVKPGCGVDTTAATEPFTVYSGTNGDSGIQSNVLVCEPIPDIYRYKSSSCQRPVELMTFIVTKFTRADDLVVDPMCGSGSSLVAAEINGRRWIGGDVDYSWVKVARERIVEPQYTGLIHAWVGGKNPLRLIIQ